jgi:hypothetical protein
MRFVFRIQPFRRLFEHPEYGILYIKSHIP